jgi:alkylated DNA repair dioxygenase AlkB
MVMTQNDLFGASPLLPEGLRYAPDVISPPDEAELLTHVRTLPFKAFEFHGFLGKRRVVSFGWKYDYDERLIRRVDDMPEFLLPVREVAAAFAGIPTGNLQQALVSEYEEGAGIGWHRDKPEYDDVVGISLLSPCPFRLRRKSGAKWERVTLDVQPRSAYLLRGPVRTQWEHSIVAVPALRYSITFRSLTAAAQREYEEPPAGPAV